MMLDSSKTGKLWLQTVWTHMPLQILYFYHDTLVVNVIVRSKYQIDRVNARISGQCSGWRSLEKGRLWCISVFFFFFFFLLTLCEATARSTKLRKMQSYKSVFYQKKKPFCLLQPYLVWKFLSHWSRKTSPKVRGTLKSLPKVVSKRSHQEECIQSAKTAKSVASCVTSQVLQVTDKLPSFPRKQSSLRLKDRPPNHAVV